MPRGHDSLADYYRAHRAEMELALATGCTPLEARAELRRQAKARRDACGTRVPDHRENESGARCADPQAGFEQWNAPWMQRD